MAKQLVDEEEPPQHDAHVVQAYSLFRKAGFSIEAIKYHLTPGGAEMIALHNGIPVANMAAAFFYAPNPYMKDWFDRLGVAHAAGHQVLTDRRWMTPEQLSQIGF